MIYCNGTRLKIDGNAALICLEVENIIRELRDEISKEIGIDGAEEIINSIVKNSKKSEDEINLEFSDLTERIIRDFIFGYAKEGE